MTAYENWIMTVANKSENPKVAIKVILVNDLFNQNPQAYKLMEEAGQTKFGEEAFNVAVDFLIQKTKNENKNC
jgi:hypothetical protein